MKNSARLVTALVLLFSVCACGSDGKMYKEGQNKFSLGRTIFAVGGTALAVMGAAACADSPGCAEGLANGFSGGPSFTGGPNFDWDQFSNGQFRCRNISNGQFDNNSECYGMPKDDDRWPN